MGSQLNAQKESGIKRAGVNFSFGTQQFFPYNDPDYNHDVSAYKAQITYAIFKPGVISYELQFEPGIFRARHQLLNVFFVQPDAGDDYLLQREIFAKETTITEYALNVGFIMRYTPKDKLSLFVLGSIGPMISNTETERLARGFAFSDIIAVGMAYKVGKVMFEIRPGLRHVSNADLKMPNSGHNSSNIDFGISFIL